MSSSVSRSDILNASKAVARAMGTKPYALVGGAACQLLGSQRTTKDVDFVVCENKTGDARELLKKSGEFTIDPRTKHTNYGEVVIEILAPPGLYRGKFDENTPTQQVDGVKILSTLQLLDSKCQALNIRPTAAQKITDAADIKFLLELLTASGGPLTNAKEQVPHADEQFIRGYKLKYGEAPWEKAGFALVSKYPLPAHMQLRR